MPHVRALTDGRGVAFEVQFLVDYKMFSLNIFECLMPRVLFKFDQVKNACSFFRRSTSRGEV